MFLILIAVALFAALSYAVVSSTRTSGGTTDNEAALINSAQINSAQLTQYPASLRAAVVRMIIGGVEITDLEFNPPSEFANCTSEAVCVFHPNGGGATYAEMPLAMLRDSNPDPVFKVNLEMEVNHIGSSLPSDLGGNDLIAFLHSVDRNLCEKLHDRLSLGAVPPATLAHLAVQSEQMDHSYTLPTGETILGTASANSAVLSGQPEGCYCYTPTACTYYQVLLER